MIRSCSRTAICNSPTQQVLPPLTLTQLVNQVSTIPYGWIYKALFLLAFHGFFRISNLLPISQAAFQSLRNITRGDIAISSPGLLVLLKWTNTLQASRDQHLIPLAATPENVLFPMLAEMQLNRLHPVPSTAPMFSHMVRGGLMVVIQTQSHTVISTVLITMGLNPSDYGFHTFRRSGAPALP